MSEQNSASKSNHRIENRVIELLRSTNLTFKDIVLRLKNENMPITVGAIRKINQNNRYRQPRYDSKLTPTQRESLVRELQSSTSGSKPNLSLLAKRYGVCHGSVWYWWDKLNRATDGQSSHSQSRRSQLKYRRDDLTLDPNYDTVGRVCIVNGQGATDLPIIMFAKRAAQEGDIRSFTGVANRQ